MSIADDVVSDYILRHQEAAAKELRWFEIQRSLGDAVSLAALAKGPGGKRLAHQRRIPRRVLGECRRRLVGSLDDLRGARSFEDLHDVVAATIGPIRGIGPLTIYDTSLRVGANLGLEPEQVFLHAGTRVGARRLGLDVARTAVPVEELPQPLWRLRPREIEDVLCIYKDRLGRDRSGLWRDPSSGRG